MDRFEFTGYYPGAIGDIVGLHGSYYAEHWGLDRSFEVQVARELSVFVELFDPGRDGLWIAKQDGSFAGAVAIAGDVPGEDGARLRWFIIRPDMQGRGLGSALLTKAVTFCRDKGYPSINLWTFKGLDAARNLYLRAGFKMTLEQEVSQWGRDLLEQRYDLVFD